MENKRTNVLDWSFEETQAAMGELKQPKYRAKQLWDWLYHKDVWSFDEMSNFPAELREELKRRYDIRMPAVVDSRSAADGTEKLLLELDGDPHRRIETVLMPDDARTTQCVSSQVGCALDCAFCATATMDFRRNMTPGQITGQVLLGRRRTVEAGRALTNIVFMGMGEPLLNFENLLIALKTITTPEGMAMAPSRITVSTAGVTENLKQLADQTKVNIAISLNASDRKTRDELMPAVSKKYPMDELIQTAKEISRDRRKPVMFEYILMSGVNDSTEDAARLVKLLKDSRIKVNLIPYNEFPGSPFKRPALQHILDFQAKLREADVLTFIRWSQGEDIAAACGQLAVKKI